MILITDEQFEQAIHNQDYEKILIASISRYGTKYNTRYHKNMILWEALRAFNPEKHNIKFTTYLYHRARWYVLSKYKAKKRNKETVSMSSIQEISSDIECDKSLMRKQNLKEILEGLDMCDRDILEDKFLKQMTLKEIASKDNTSITSTYYKVQQALENARTK